MAVGVKKFPRRDLGEMRDLTSMSMALSAAETGNLVISTMATQSAAQTVTRIIDSFPPHQQPQIRAQLALTLRAVVSQILLPRLDGQGRVAAREVLFATQAVQNLVRDDKVHQIPNVISTSLRDDMVSMDDALAAAHTVLAASRPTAVNLFWALDQMSRVRDQHRNASPEALCKTLAAEALKIFNDRFSLAPFP